MQQVSGADVHPTHADAFLRCALAYGTGQDVAVLVRAPDGKQYIEFGTLRVLYDGGKRPPARSCCGGMILWAAHS